MIIYRLREVKKVSVEILSYTSIEVHEYKEQKYQQFLHYYNSTDLKVEEIFRLIGFTNTRNSTVQYIRTRLREDGYNRMQRAADIRRGEWL